MTDRSADRNARIVGRLVDELWNGTNVELVDDAFAEDCVLHDPAHIGAVRRREDQREYFERWRSRFPANTRFAIEDLVSAGDTVAFRWTGNGTPDDEFMGFTPAPVEVEVARGMAMVRIEDEEIVEVWQNYDAVDVMQHLGAAEPPST